MKVHQIRCKFSWLLTLGALLLIAVAVFAASGTRPAHALGGSAKVAVVGSLSCTSGGGLPTTDPAFSFFSFTNVAPASVYTDVTFNTAPNYYDTVLLNVCSPQMNCTTAGTLTAAAKTALGTFVGSGGKLIIHDSECPPSHNTPVDYTWLPFPFTVTWASSGSINGTLTIEEQNILSTSSSSDSHYIDAASMSLVSEVGDAGFMTTLDPHWCLDMSVTRIDGVTGPVHTYARYQSGLMIYNGLDVDTALAEVTPPAPNGLQQIWLQELQAPLHPTVAELPCGVPVVPGTALPCAHPPLGLAAWWPLDELKGDTTIRDYYHHTGTPMPGRVGLGGPRPSSVSYGSPVDPPQIVGGSLDFFGLDGTMFVNVPNNYQLEPRGGNFSIDAWAYPVTPDPNVLDVIQPIVDKWEPRPPVGPVQGGYAFYIQNGHLMFQYSDGGPIFSADSGTPRLPYDRWSHVAVTLKRTGPGTADVRLYINGQQQGTLLGSSLGAITNGRDLRIGGTRLPTPAGLAEIALDEVEIIDAAVPQPDIQRIYNALNSGKCQVFEVGGTAALTVSNSGSPVPSLPLATVAAAALAMLTAGLWYGRRRWLR